MDKFGKILTDINKVTETYGQNLEYVNVEEDHYNPITFKILRLKEYNFDFLKLQEVIILNALLVKYKSFKQKPFYFTRDAVKEELGIGKSVYNNALNKFVKLEIIRIKKSKKKGNKFPTKYIDFSKSKIKKLIPKIWDLDKHAFPDDIKYALDKFLLPKNY